MSAAQAQQQQAAERRRYLDGLADQALGEQRAEASRLREQSEALAQAAEHRRRAVIACDAAFERYIAAVQRCEAASRAHAAAVREMHDAAEAYCGLSRSAGQSPRNFQASTLARRHALREAAAIRSWPTGVAGNYGDALEVKYAKRSESWVVDERRIGNRQEKSNGE